MVLFFALLLVMRSTSAASTIDQPRTICGVCGAVPLQRRSETTTIATGRCQWGFQPLLAMTFRCHRGRLSHGTEKQLDRYVRILWACQRGPGSCRAWASGNSIRGAALCRKPLALRARSCRLCRHCRQWAVSGFSPAPQRRSGPVADGPEIIRRCPWFFCCMIAIPSVVGG